MKGIYTVVSGAVAQERRLGFISNNLANALTTGYKSSKAVFEAVLSSSVIDIETNQEDNTFVGTYDSYINFAEGSLVRPATNLTLPSRGMVSLSYARHRATGIPVMDSLRLMQTASLLHRMEIPVAGEGGDIIMDGREVTIETDGSVFVDKAPAGKLKTVRFATKEYLRPVGNSLFENVNPANQELPRSTAR